jgi:hypothetical protein
VSASPRPLLRQMWFPRRHRRFFAMARPPSVQARLRRTSSPVYGARQLRLTERTARVVLTGPEALQVPLMVALLPLAAKQASTRAASNRFPECRGLSRSSRLRLAPSLASSSSRASSAAASGSEITGSPASATWQPHLSAGSDLYTSASSSGRPSGSASLHAGVGGLAKSRR